MRDVGLPMKSAASWLILAFFAALSVALTWPLSQQIASAVEDRLDALLNVWILAWDGRQLLLDPLRLFEANIFHPYPTTLAYSEIILPQALLALPFTLASGNPVLGYNIALLCSFALSGFAAYLLAFRLTGSRLGGLSAGVVYAFNAYRMSNLAQAQLLALQWLPLALLYLHSALAPGRREQPVARSSLLLALFFLLQALSSYYYALLTALALALYMAIAVIGRRIGSIRRLAAVGAALAVATVLLLPTIAPYVAVQQSLAFRRSIADSIPFSASLAQYVQALPTSLAYGQLAPSQPVVIGGYPLDSLFPGLGVLALAALGAWRWRPTGVVRLFTLVLLAGGFVLSLGPVLTVSPGQTIDTPFALPYRWLYALPAMQALRAPVRFAALVFLALSLLAGAGVAALGRVQSKPGAPAGRLAALLSTVALAVLVVEAIVVPAAQIAPVPTGAQTSPVYVWLSRQAPGVILELPMIASAPERGLLNQYFSIYHWQRSPDGYSGFFPPKHGEIVYEMQYFPSERSITLLRGLDVRYLIVHRTLIADWPEREQRLAAFAGDIALQEQFGDTLVYRVASASALTQKRYTMYLPPTALPEADYTASLILLNEGTSSIFTSPIQPLKATLVWKNAEGRTVASIERAVSMPMVVSGAGTAALAVPAPAAGRYVLSVRVVLPDGGELRESQTVIVAAQSPPPGIVAPLRLLSGAADRDNYQPGDNVRVTLRWHALGKIDAYYSVFVRLLDSNGQALVQRDGQPAMGQRPTLLWTPGDKIDDAWTLPIPLGAPAGRYTLEAGMYLAQDLSPRLTLGKDGVPVERLLLATLRLAPPLEPSGKPSLPLAATLGGKARLVGFDLEGCTWVQTTCLARRGQSLTLGLYWQPVGEISAAYTVFVHLANAGDAPISQHDGQPRDGAYPTTVWRPGDLVVDHHQIVIPSDVTPGDYRLLTGMYDAATGARLTAPDGDAVLLAMVAIP